MSAPKPLPPRFIPADSLPANHFYESHNGAWNRDQEKAGQILVKMPEPTDLGALADWLDRMIPKRPFKVIAFLRLMHAQKRATIQQIQEAINDGQAWDVAYLLAASRGYIEQHPMPFEFRQTGNEIERIDRSN